VSKKLSRSIILATALVFVSTEAVSQAASGNWYFRSDVQGLAGSYSGSQQRETLQNLGIFVRADYLERAGVTVGYNRTALSFGDSSQDISQDSLFVSARWQMTPDWTRGRIAVRLDGHAISNDDVTNETDDITTFAPQISYLNFDETFYFDLGFSRSAYGDSSTTAGELDIDQLTPTLGFGFNEQLDWVQLRAYLINPSNPQRAQDQEDIAALEMKWTHWFVSRRPLGVDNFRLAALLGERLFAVDPDAGSIYNLADLQTGGFSLGAEWAPSERNRILLVVGAEAFENRAFDESYRNAFAYVNFTHLWN
jgi:hypothetical protein